MQDTALADSLAAAADSLAADTAAADTSNAISQITENIQETGRAIREGRFDEVYERLSSALIDFALNGLIPSLLTLLLFYLVYRVVTGLLERVLSRSKQVNLGVRQLLLKSFRLVFITLGAIVVLDMLGMNVGALIAGLGIAGIALGFAARDTLENFISGITILLDQPFRVGDNVEVEGTFGSVQEITLRSTRIRTLNNEVAVLPNAHMIQQKLINHTLLGVLRIVVPFGIAYKEYPQEAREVVLKLPEDDERLHPDYTPQVVVTKMNDSSVDMELRLFLKDPKLEVPVRFEYIEKVREALREADIEVPFPHLQLFIDEAQAFQDAPFMQPGNGSGTKPQAEA
ncbi:MAG: mechanosensitive ion channel family protein [Bacteroidota bacterium]